MFSSLFCYQVKGVSSVPHGVVAEEAGACGSERLLLVEAVGSGVHAVSKLLLWSAEGNVDRRSRSVGDVHRLTREEAVVDRGKGKATTMMVAGLWKGEGIDNNGGR
ncbi:hypothetical protein BHM03_00038734 [Ensete ventricosum]|nr:hypothetical protein BHM03_00038734 [Ensete ventricosum]